KTGADLVAEDEGAPQRRYASVQRLDAREPAAQHDDIGIEDVDDAGERSRQAQRIPVERLTTWGVPRLRALRDLRRVERAAGAPRAAPSMASASAKQLASFAMRTGCFNARSRSPRRSRPLRHVELALRMSPVRSEVEPGVATPIVASPRTSPRAPSTRRTMAAR